MIDSPWEIHYGLAHNDAYFQISGNKMYSSLNLVVSPNGFCFMQDRISVILASCPHWSYGPHQSFLLMILVFGMGIFVCLHLFMNFCSENDIENNSIHIHFKKNKIGRNKFNQRSTDMYIKDYTPS